MGPEAHCIYTGNCLETNTVRYPPEITNTRLTWNTPVQELYAAHRRAVQAYQLQHPEATPCAHASMDDTWESDYRVQQLKKAFQEKAGYISREELQEIGASAASRKDLERIGDELEKLQKKD